MLHLHHQNALGYKSHTFRIDFDPSLMILTFTSVANVYIIRYPEQPNQPGDLWGCGVLGGRRNTMISITTTSTVEFWPWEAFDIF